MNREVAERKLAERSMRADSGCLEWTRGRDWDGYGAVRIEGVQYRTHRLAWALANGPIPTGMVIRHSCDNPPCIDPQHLLVGTHTDNNRDRELRGRSADRRGERCPTAKLTWVAVREIRRLLAEGKSHTSIAPQYGVKRETVSRIYRGEIWKESTL